MKWGFLAALLSVPLLASGQGKVYVAGYVSDLESSQPLEYVSIFSNGKIISSTDHNGYFTLAATQNDSLVFSRLGYKPYVIVAAVTNWDERVLMSEMKTVLDEVVIREFYRIHGHDQVQKSLKEDKRSNTINFVEQPGMVKTFGPSVGVVIPWDKWSREGREKKKLQRIQLEHQRTAVYREFIHSMEVEQYMVTLFNLDHDKYLKNKEGFIIAYPDARYLKSRKDIIDLMVAYFALKKD